jgi:hypothetical protein
MAFDAQNMRDLLSLARMLRRFAEQHQYDSRRNLFLVTAAALEARAHALAAAPDGNAGPQERDGALHAPVNRVI